MLSKILKFELFTLYLFNFRYLQRVPLCSLNAFQPKSFPIECFGSHNLRELLFQEASEVLCAHLSERFDVRVLESRTNQISRDEKRLLKDLFIRRLADLKERPNVLTQLDDRFGSAGSSGRVSGWISE